jgi:hypothetical protein
MSLTIEKNPEKEPAEILLVPKNGEQCIANIQPGGFMHRMSEIMSQSKVETFFSDYFATWSDAQTSLMMMHAYVAIAQADAQRRRIDDPERLSATEIVKILKKMVSDANCRKMMVDAMSQYTATGNLGFIEAFEMIQRTKIEK